MSRHRKSSDATQFDTLRLEGSLFVREPRERSSLRRCHLPEGHQFTSRRDLTRTLMAEECVTLAVVGRANPQWPTDADLTPLLAAEPAANLTEAAAIDHIQTTLDFFKSQTPYLENLARQRADALLADHRRVRQAVRDIGTYKVTPCLPVDVLGVYVLLPKSL